MFEDILNIFGNIMLISFGLFLLLSIFDIGVGIIYTFTKNNQKRSVLLKMIITNAKISNHLFLFLILLLLLSFNKAYIAIYKIFWPLILPYMFVVLCKFILANLNNKIRNMIIIDIIIVSLIIFSIFFGNILTGSTFYYNNYNHLIALSEISNLFNQNTFRYLPFLFTLCLANASIISYVKLKSKALKIISSITLLCLSIILYTNDIESISYIYISQIYIFPLVNLLIFLIKPYLGMIINEFFIIFLLLIFANKLYPYLLKSNLDRSQSLNIFNAHTNLYTLEIMLNILVYTMPIILLLLIYLIKSYKKQ